jgi:hypothetical protein
MEQRSQDDLLLNYLDGNLDDVRLKALKAELEKSEPMRKRLQELRMVHDVLSRQQLESPASNFVARVMSNLHNRPSAVTLSPRNGLMLVLGTSVAIGLLLLLVQAGVFNGVTRIITMPQTIPSQKYIPNLPSVSISLKLIVNILMGLNLLLALVVLDRTVLKPYFQKRAGAGL